MDFICFPNLHPFQCSTINRYNFFLTFPKRTKEEDLFFKLYLSHSNLMTFSDLIEMEKLYSQPRSSCMPIVQHLFPELTCEPKQLILKYFGLSVMGCTLFTTLPGFFETAFLPNAFDVNILQEAFLNILEPTSVSYDLFFYCYNTIVTPIDNFFSIFTHFFGTPRIHVKLYSVAEQIELLNKSKKDLFVKYYSYETNSVAESRSGRLYFEKECEFVQINKIIKPFECTYSDMRVFNEDGTSSDRIRY